MDWADRADRVWEDEGFLRDEAALPRRPPRSGQNLYGVARLARDADLAPLLTPPREPHTLVLPDFSPIVEAECPAGVEPRFLRRLHLGEELTSRHVLLVGRTGSGKTYRVILPLVASMLADRERSVVLFDVKGELYEPVDELARRAGRPSRSVLRLDLTDPARSIGWNPVGPSASSDQTFDVAHQLCHASERRSDSPFWVQTSVDVIAGILDALGGDHDESATLARVREILNLPRDRFMKWFSAHEAVPSLQRFAAFLAVESHNAHTCLTDASNRLLAFLDAALCAVTSSAELDLAELVERPTVLVVVVPESQIERLRPLFNLFVQVLCSTLVRAADRSPGARLRRPVSIVLDEFATALGRLPDFEIRLNTMRSRRVSVIAAIQGIGQLRHVYESAREPLLAGFATKVFFSEIEVEDAEYASRLSGTTTVDEMQGQERWDDEARAFVPFGRSTRPVGRPLLLPGEVANPVRHFELGPLSTWFVAGVPPFHAWTMPAWRRADLGRVLARARRGELAHRGRRRQPLEFPARTPAGSGRNTLTAVLLRQQEARLGLEYASRRARLRWAQLRRRYFDDVEGLLRLATELARRGLDVEQFFQASARCGTNDPTAILHFVDYESARRRSQDDRHRTGRLPFPDDGFGPEGRSAI